MKYVIINTQNGHAVIYLLSYAFLTFVRHIFPQFVFHRFEMIITLHVKFFHKHFQCSYKNALKCNTYLEVNIHDFFLSKIVALLRDYDYWLV